jgi:predicted peptidase
MNKNLRKISLLTSMLLLVTGTTVSAATATNTINVEPKYTTVTEGFDWGPAITEVTLNMNTELKDGAVSAKTFNVKSERKYNGIDWTKLDMKSVNPTYVYMDYDKIVDRVITAAYVSDEKGTKVDSGNYVTIEMKVGPDLTEGSPFNYDIKSGLNKYVDTSYLISLNKGETILNKDSANVSITTTTANDKAGNKTLISDDFDLSGVSSYKDDKYGDITLHYASYAPKEDNKKNPLVIWLHGAGEGGTDPTIAITGNKVVLMEHIF